jgi:hypothetical protein
MQLNPEYLGNDELLSKSDENETAWHMAEVSGNVEFLEKLSECAK